MHSNKAQSQDFDLPIDNREVSQREDRRFGET
jgi:hypothetical protein